MQNNYFCVSICSLHLTFIVFTNNLHSRYRSPQYHCISPVFHVSSTITIYALARFHYQYLEHLFERNIKLHAFAHIVSAHTPSIIFFLFPSSLYSCHLPFWIFMCKGSNLSLPLGRIIHPLLMFLFASFVLAVSPASVTYRHKNQDPLISMDSMFLFLSLFSF